MNSSDSSADDDIADSLQSVLDAADAESDTDGEDDEDDGGGPAMDYALKLGLPLAVVTVGLLFVGPEPLVRFTPGSDVLLEGIDGSGLGPIPYISGAVFCVAFLAGVTYPHFGEELYDEFKTDLAMGTLMPTGGLMALIVGITVFWPVVHFALGGQLITATVLLVLIAVIIAISLSASIGILALAVIAGLYLVVPSVLGAYLGGFIGEFVAGRRATVSAENS